MISKYSKWLKWWMGIMLIGIGSTILYTTGIVNNIYECDITKLTFIIYSIFMFFTIKMGMNTYKLCRHDEKQDIDNIIKWSGRLPSIGIIGTVIGFIYLFSTAFIDIEAADSAKHIITQLGKGMGTALYTTAAGLICSLILELQIDNYLDVIDSEDKS